MMNKLSKDHANDKINKSLINTLNLIKQTIGNNQFNTVIENINKSKEFKNQIS